MPLRTADMTSTRRFEDGDDYLVLRVGGLTKGEADRLHDITAAYKIDPSLLAGVADPQQAARIEIDQRTMQANQALFALLVVEWSLPQEPTGQAYADLDQESGNWVDECIGEVLRERQKRAVKNAPSSAKPRKRASSSARAAAST